MKQAFGKRSLACIVAVLMAGTAFAGCTSHKSSSQSSSSGSGSSAASQLDSNTPQWKNHTTPLTLTWYINYSWYVSNWGKDYVSQEIEKLTGDKIQFIIPASDDNSKLNTMIASKTLPDIVTIGAPYQQAEQTMIRSKEVYSLNELADKYDPYFYKVTNPQKLNWFKQSDGNVYAYPNASFTNQDYADSKGMISSNQSFLVQKSMYEALGEPDMSTPEGFINTLKAAEAKFPAVNGQPLIPIGLEPFDDTGNYALESYLQNYLGIPTVKDGKEYDRSTDAEYIKWLKTFSEAYRDGLIPKDVFIDQRSQIEEKVSQNRYFALMYQWSDCQDQLKAVYTKNPDNTYIAVRGPADDQKDPPTLAGSGDIAGWCINMITKNCKNPDRAVELFDFLMSTQGQQLAYCGVEGKSYTMQNGKVVFNSDMLKMDVADTAKFDQTYGNFYEYWMFEINDPKEYFEWSNQVPEVEPAKQIEDWTKPYATNFTLTEAPTFTAGTSLYTINTNVTNLWGKTLPQLIMASSDSAFDQLWKSWIAQRDQLGYSKILAANETQYEENVKKMGS